MIDEKKIENAARVCGSHFIGDNEDAAAQYGFKKGAAWALQEFKKSLWHDASEEPEKEKPVLFKHWDYFSAQIASFDKNWDEFVSYYCVECWCYIDDLFPNKEDKK